MGLKMSMRKLWTEKWMETAQKWQMGYIDDSETSEEEDNNCGEEAQSDEADDI